MILSHMLCLIHMTINDDIEHIYCLVFNTVLVEWISFPTLSDHRWFLCSCPYERLSDNLNTLMYVLPQTVVEGEDILDR
jgi:hypothetical protein